MRFGTVSMSFNRVGGSWRARNEVYVGMNRQSASLWPWNA